MVAKSLMRINDTGLVQSVSQITPSTRPDFEPSRRYEWNVSGSAIVRQVLDSILSGRIPASMSWRAFAPGRSTQTLPPSSRNSLASKSRATPAIRDAAPRQPACTAERAPLSGSDRNNGTQSANKTPRMMPPRHRRIFPAKGQAAECVSDSGQPPDDLRTQKFHVRRPWEVPSTRSSLRRARSQWRWSHRDRRWFS